MLVTGIDSRAETHRGRPLFFRHIQNHIPTFPNILEIRSQYFPIYSKSDPNIFQCIQNYISIYSKSHQNIFQYIQNHIPKYIQSKLYPKVFQPASNILHNIADISCDVSCVLIIIFVYLYICFFLVCFEPSLQKQSENVVKSGVKPALNFLIESPNSN